MKKAVSLILTFAVLATFCMVGASARQYTQEQLTEIIRLIWEDKEFQVEYSGTHIGNVIHIGIVNPPENAEVILRKRYNYDKIVVEPIWREFIQPGDWWRDAVRRTEAKTRGDSTGWGINKATGQRVYFKDGTRLTGVQIIGGISCVFNQNGILLGKRAVNRDYTVNFADNANVKISDGIIKFNVSFKNQIPNCPEEGFWANPHFKLFVYLDGRWKEIPYASDGFDDYILTADAGQLMSFSKRLSEFSCEFTPGLYRVRVGIGGGSGGGRTVIGEFNLV